MRKALFLALALLGAGSSLAWAGADSRPIVRIGTVAGDDQQPLGEQVTGLSAYFESRIPEYRFRQVVFPGYAEILEGVAARKVDFVHVNSGLYVQMEVRFGALAISTSVRETPHGNRVSTEASALFCLADRTDIRRLEDLRGKRLVGVNPMSLSGALAGLRELGGLGLRPGRDFQIEYSWNRKGVPRGIMEALESGVADCGVLGSSLLAEGMVLGTIPRSRIKVLPAPHDYPGIRDFPFPVSTRLYPRSPFATLGHTPLPLANRVAVALLDRPAEREVDGGILFWSGPLNYMPVHDCLRDLGLPPYAEYGKVTLLEAVRQHLGTVLLVSFAAMLVLAGVAIRTLALNRRLKASVKAWEESQRMLRAVLDTIPVRVYWKGPAGRFMGCNRLFAEDVGLPAPEAIIDKTPADLPHADTSLEQEIEDRRIIEGGLPQRDWEERHDPAGRWQRISKIPLREGGRTEGLLCVFEDITEQKKAQAERVKLEEQLRQSQKMESLGRLAGGVAHDFNNLLTVINGYAEVLEDELPASSLQKGQVEEIHKAGRRAADLTQQLLAFSRKQIIAPQALNLNTVIGEAEKMLRRLVGEDIEFVTILRPGLGSVEADAGQILQVLVNLVINARDAMPDGGHLIIETGNIDLDSSYAATHPSVQPGSFVQLIISDSGCGMDAETLRLAFEPFFTTKGQEKGTGLGLATVYGIVKQSAGWIWAYSEVGKGTTFKIYLPRVDAVPLPEQPQPVEQVTGPVTETILVVEDQDQLRHLACDVLAGAGYQVLDAKNGEEALVVAERFDGLIDLLFTDVVMPGMTGRTLAHKLGSFRPEAHVLYTSGYAEEVVAHRGMLEPGIEYLPKPFSPEQLLRKVRKMLNS